jgi:hypothetical protein
MTTMKTWKIESPATEEERDLLVKNVIRELRKGQPGDWTMNLDAEGGVLAVGTIDSTGQLHVFECDIRRSNIESEQIIMEGEVARAPQKTSFLA